MEEWLVLLPFRKKVTGSSCVVVGLLLYQKNICEELN